jgi:hypothetical protein
MKTVIFPSFKANPIYFHFKVQVNEAALLGSEELELPNGLKMKRKEIFKKEDEDDTTNDIAFEV